MGILIYFIIIMILPMAVHFWLKKTYKKYSKINVTSGITGAMAARQVLDAKGLSNVRVMEVAGELTDHYDPTSNTVYLSSANYHGSSVAAVSVSIHEVGHAVQKSENYVPLKLRHSLVPVANLGSNMSYLFILLGIVLTSLNMLGIGTGVFLIGILAMAAALLFQVVTLPVEFNASSRAKNYLYDYGIVDRNEESGVSKVLTAAALTYVAATVVAAAELLRYVLMFAGINNRD